MKLSIVKKLFLKLIIVFSMFFIIEAGVSATQNTVNGIVLAPSSSSPPMPPQDPPSDVVSKCNEASTKAEQATVGMDMTSYLLVGQTVQSSASAVQGSSAKLAHQGNAAIQGTLSAAALKRCAACQTAIKTCEKDCKASLCTEIVKKSEPTCQTSLTEGFKKCGEQKRDCSLACLQGGLSGIQAMNSMLAARILGDCSAGDENCIKNQNQETEDSALDVPTAGAGGPGSSLGMVNPWGNQPPPSVTDPLIPPDNNFEENQTEENTDGRENDSPTDGKDFAALTSGTGLGSSGSSTGTGSQAFKYGKNAKSLGSEALSGNEEEEYEEDEKNYPSNYSVKGNFGGKRGGYARSSSDYNGGKVGNGSASLGGNRKLAMMDKKEDTFGKAKPIGSIFTQMSRFIQRVCHKEMKCP